MPGAERQQAACLVDLTTAGTTRTGHTDQTDWMGMPARGTRNPSGVPGIQVDGYFPDTSTFNSYRGWFHDAQFVLRLPDRWNGKLVVTGAPGVRRQYANDFIISDWVLSRGYAHASTDKGNSGTSFYRDGVRPGDAVAEWHQRVTELTLAARQVVAQRYGKPPGRTYLTGISNGGYLTRWQLEHRLAVGRVSLTGAIGQPMLIVARQARRPAAHPHRLRRVRRHGGRAGPRRPAPVLRRAGRQPRRRPVRRLLRPAPADPPCYRAAFVALERWVEQGQAPPPTGLVPRPATGDVVNQCTLPVSPDEGQPDRRPRDQGQPGVGRSPLGP